MAVEADPKFVREVIRLGGKTLKRCMQCATCSVICPISPEDSPFPRKEMIWAQWGLKERLLRDPDVWLCHNCNDCSKYCPRNAKPGEVLSALRARMIAEYSWPSFMAKIVNNPVYFPLFLLIPIVVIGALLSAFHLTIPSGGEVDYTKFIPAETLEMVAIPLGGLVILIALVGLWRFWNALTEGGGKHILIEPKEGAELDIKGGISFVDAVFMALKDILKHSWFKICEVNRSRYYAHLLIFYGFIILGIVAGLDVIAKNVFGIPHLPIWHPVKILGNIGAAALFIGCTWAIYNRLTNPDAKGGSYFDWFFLLDLYGVAITGILTEAARLAGSVIGYWFYLAHLVTIFMLIIYAPYSKFAHLVYRGVAMAYAKATGREPKIVYQM